MIRHRVGSHTQTSGASCHQTARVAANLQRCRAPALRCVSAADARLAILQAERRPRQPAAEPLQASDPWMDAVPTALCCARAIMARAAIALVASVLYSPADHQRFTTFIAILGDRLSTVARRAHRAKAKVAGCGRSPQTAARCDVALDLTG